MGRDVQLGLMSLMRKGWRGSGVGEAFCVQLLGSTSLGMVCEGNSFWGLVVGCTSVAKKRVGGQTRALWVQGGVLLRELGALQELVLEVSSISGLLFGFW